MAKPTYRLWDKNQQVMYANNELIIWNGYVYANNDRELTVDSLKGWSVLDEYLMWSTKRKDKNDKEIFAGDILKVTDKVENKESWLEIVSYSEEKAMFVTEEVNKHHKFPTTPLYDLFNTDLFVIEVIGNIYENADLVGDK
jgi:hypothetical protein